MATAYTMGDDGRAPMPDYPFDEYGNALASVVGTTKEVTPEQVARMDDMLTYNYERAREKVPTLSPIEFVDGGFVLHMIPFDPPRYDDEGEEIYDWDGRYDYRRGWYATAPK